MILLTEPNVSEISRSLVLPNHVFSRSDIIKLLMEIDQIDVFLRREVSRKPGTPTELPKNSPLLQSLAKVNELNLLHQKDRYSMLSFLIAIRAKAPELHFSFSVDPDVQFKQKIIIWLRQEIHPFMLIQVGLRPNLGAGCVIRSNNLTFDLSLKKYFSGKKQVLIDMVKHEGVNANTIVEK